MTKKPSYRFTGFEDEWEQQKASKIFYSVSDKNHVDLPVLSASQEHGMVKRDEIGIDIKYDKASVKTYKRVRPGQFVIHLRSFQGGFAHSYIEGITSPAYTVLDFSTSNKHFDLFWKEVFTSQNFIKRLETVTYGIRDGRSISFSDFSSLKLQFPSLPEQTTIGSFFQDIDQLISLQQRKIEVLKEQKKTYLKLLFPAKGQTKPALRFAGFEDKWKEVKLGKVGETYTGLSGKTKEDFGHGEGKFITYVNVFNNPLTDLYGLDSVEIDDKQRRVQYGDVLFTTSSETPEDVGLSSVWLGKKDNVYLNSFCFGYRPQKGIFDLYYLAFVLRSFNVRREFMLLAQGISRFNISKTKVMDMSIHVPSLPEQEAIGSFFQDLDKAIAKQEEKVNQLKESKQTLLRKMFI